MDTVSRRSALAGGLAAVSAGLASPLGAAEQRNEVSFLRGPYNLALYYRHNYAYRVGAGMHVFHSKQHDLLQLTPLADHAAVDARFDREAVAYMRNPPRIEPKMPYYSNYVSRAMHTLFRAIDWTHIHHEQTYDVLASEAIPWSQKKAWTDRAVRYYLQEQELGLPRSPAPLDVTMRRAAFMMKPYWFHFANYYPLNQSAFFVAHWWHPVLYEAMMIAGNDGQEATVQAHIDLLNRRTITDRPQRMLLSREIMPRYARMSPESANIFDNLHMLHGVAYSILAYEGWTVEQKRDEMYRIVYALGYHPGDERLARKFREPHPEFDPRTYPDWVRAWNGEMTRIQMEMMTEMMPLMYPQGLSQSTRAAMMEQFQRKIRLGHEPGEPEGSIREALMAIAPDMQAMPGATQPGETPQMMVDAMLRGWRQKYGGMPDIPPLDMSAEPRLG
jgi:hypothetical protein